MKKIIQSVVFVLIIGLLIPITGKAAGFSDVSTGYTFYNEVVYLSSKNVITGYTDATFRPDMVVTRAQAAIMIGRALGYAGGSKDTTFTDVNSSVTGSGYIAEAAANGIISGFTDNTYRPNSPVTRAQMAIFLDRAFDLTVGQNNSFHDVSSNMAAYQPILNVSASGVAGGYSKYTYRPDEHVNRGQFSAFLARTLEPSLRLSPTDENSELIPVPGLDNIALGMTKDEVKNLETAWLINDEQDQLVYNNKLVFDYTATVSYKFENGKLISVTILHDFVNNKDDLDLLENYFYVMYDKLSNIYGDPAILDTDWNDDAEGYSIGAYWVNGDQDTLLTSMVMDDYSSFGGISISTK